MTEPTTLRLILSIANALDLELDHLDIKTAYLNAELPEKERFYCSPPAGFKVPAGYGLFVTKGLYGAHQRLRRSMVYNLQGIGPVREGSSGGRKRGVV